jgi:transcription elongation GreA/GreB family factor
MDGRTIYLTREGLATLRAELDHLQTVARSQTSERIRRTETVTGAKSEAARYDLAFLEGRIAELQRTLAGARLISVRQEVRAPADGTNRP